MTVWKSCGYTGTPSGAAATIYTFLAGRCDLRNVMTSGKQVFSNGDQIVNGPMTRTTAVPLPWGGRNGLRGPTSMPASATPEDGTVHPVPSLLFRYLN